MNLKDHRVEPISTAPHDQGRLLRVVIRRSGRRPLVAWASWWRHWTMAEGCWWSPEYGVVDPFAWVAE